MAVGWRSKKRPRDRTAFARMGSMKYCQSANRFSRPVRPSVSKKRMAALGYFRPFSTILRKV